MDRVSSTPVATGESGKRWQGRGQRAMVRPWSDEERALLCELHNDNLTASEIASRLGRTAEAVCNMGRRLGLRRRESAQPWTQGQLWQLNHMIEDGRSLNEIAEATGHPRSSVADKLRQLNVKSQRFRQPWTDEECQIVLRLHAAGAGLADITAALPRRSADGIQQKLQELIGPAPFRSGRPRSKAAPESPPVEVMNEPPYPRPSFSPPAEPPRVTAPAQVISLPPPPAPRIAVRFVRERAVSRPPEPVVPITASTDEMVRWLRSRDFMVLHRPPGWQVDHHRLEDEAALLAFVNLRRVRLNLPPFVRSR